MERRFKCGKCGKDFAMEWAQDNHTKNCINSKKNQKRR